MTNLEALIAAVQVPVSSYPTISLEKALLDAEISPNDDYYPSSDDAGKKQIDFAAIEILKGMLTVEKVDEGGYAIWYSREGIQARLNYLLDLYDLLPVVTGPTIRNKSYMW